MKNRSYLNGVLTVIAVLLALNLLVKVSDTSIPGAALAQPKGENVNSPPFNSAEDRKAIINGLDRLTSQVQSLEAKLDKGIKVEVTKMPPINVSGGKDDKKELSPESTIKVTKPAEKAPD